MSFHPLYSFFNTINLLLRGKMHFPRGRLGKTVTMEDGQEFTIFREVKIDDNQSGDNSAVFRVRFLLSGMKPEDNIRFSWIPSPFIMGLPGFQAKLWTLNYENNYFQGIYQWENSEYADKYSKSFAYRFMAGRSVEGTVSYEIIPNMDLERYLKLLESRM